MTTCAVIAVALAVFSFFAWHIVDRVTDARRQKRIADEIENLKGELRNALENGNTARACQLKRRLQELVAS